ncbi:MAG: hypothetical protein VKK62_07855 [Synechococcaceae cyanobacterium]|nr:hypothetical protein [Synechococcaceae cyanobacterium]
MRRQHRPSLAAVARGGPPLLLLIALAGCSGTPLGEGLSRSFPPAADGPSPTSPPPAASPGASPPAARSSRPAGTATGGSPTPAASPAAAPGTLPPTRPPGGATPAPATGAGAPLQPGAASRSSAFSQDGVSNPAPYRVTIRLSRADPAAPAEVVTRALRAAGVPFEVETIERIPAAAVPASRPAPPPTVPVR